MYREYDEDLCCLFCGEYLYVFADGIHGASPPPAEPELVARRRGRPRKELAIA
jgi:hypothetical protein